MYVCMYIYITNLNNMKNEKLIAELTEQTQILKVEYLAQTDIHARKEFANMEKVATMSREEYYTFFNVDFKMEGPIGREYVVVPYLKSEIGQCHTRCIWGGENYKRSKKVDAMVHTTKNAVERGLDAWLTKAAKNAEQHYTNSIIKLASKIAAKGLNQDALEIVTARVGVNIETTLTDGVKTVKAWTIVASGLIQKPHYRYLVK